MASPPLCPFPVIIADACPADNLRSQASADRLAVIVRDRQLELPPLHERMLAFVMRPCEAERPQLPDHFPPLNRVATHLAQTSQTVEVQGLQDGDIAVVVLDLQ